MRRVRRWYGCWLMVCGFVAGILSGPQGDWTLAVTSIVMLLIGWYFLSFDKDPGR